MIYIKKLEINNDDFIFFLNDGRIFRAKISYNIFKPSKHFLKFDNCNNYELFVILGINKWCLCNKIAPVFYTPGDWPESDKEHVILLAEALVKESQNKYIKSCPEI